MYAQHVYSPISYPPPKGIPVGRLHIRTQQEDADSPIFLLLLTWDTGEQERDTIARTARQSEGQVTEVRQRSSCLNWNKDQEVSENVQGKFLHIGTGKVTSCNSFLTGCSLSTTAPLWFVCHTAARKDFRNSEHGTHLLSPFSICPLPGLPGTIPPVSPQCLQLPAILLYPCMNFSPTGLIWVS